MLDEKIYRIQNYYKSHQKNALFILIWGLLALAFSYYAYINSNTPFWKGITYPILVLALVQIAQGLSMLLQANKREKTLVQELGAGKTTSLTNEINRVNSHLESIRRRAILQQVLIGLGVGFALTAVFADLSNLMIGSGIGLMVQAAVSYTANVLLQWRTDLYGAELRVERK